MTDLATAPSARPTRPVLRPAPRCEPPFDDELAGRPSAAGRRPVAAVQGALALDFVLPSGLPVVPDPPRHLRPVPDVGLPDVEMSGTDLGDPDAADFGPQPTARDQLPEPRAWGGRLVQALVEVLAGDRPASQLVRWTSTAVYDEVAGLVPARRRPERSAGASTGAASGRRAMRAAVRSVHVTEPADGVAEVAATVRRAGRTTAVALRLEGLDGRWQCTALQLG